MNKQTNNWTYCLFLLPSVLGVIVFQLMPLGFTFIQSFKDIGKGSFVALSNYKALFCNDLTRIAFLNLLKTLILGLIPLLVLTFLLGLSFYKAKRNHSLIMGLLLVPFFIPNASVSFFWKYIFANNGLMNEILSLLGVAKLEWIHSNLIFVVMSIQFFWRNVGVFTLLWCSGIKSVEIQQIEAAQCFGASNWIVVTKVMIPNMHHSIFLLLCLSIISVFDIFRDLYFLVGEYPSEHVFLIQNLFSTLFKNMQYGEMSAAAVVVSLILFLIMFVGYKTLHK